MAAYEPVSAARRAGVTEDYLKRLVELGIVTAGPQGKFSESELRKARVVQLLDLAGLPLDALGAVVREGHLSLDFIEAAGYQVFSPLSDTTFAQLSEQTGISPDLLSVVREAVGGLPPRADDLVREDELALLPLVQLQLREGFRPIAIERALRVYGDSLRRIAETEGEWWRSEIEQPMLARGEDEAAIAKYAADFSPGLSESSDRAVLAIYHAQQMHAWITNIANGIGGALERAGVHTPIETVPAMCFLDITGYTRLTQERGDAAGADVAEQLARLVQRTSVKHGGRPVKWLGDGVMLYFPQAGPGVVAALEMVEGVSGAGLPPAHVGLHCGPVLFQEGDYYGQTVNVAARIGDYARPGGVLVSQAVVNAPQGKGVTFTDVGPVELKGLGEVMRLHAAHRSS